MHHTLPLLVISEVLIYKMCNVMIMIEYISTLNMYECILYLYVYEYILLFLLLYIPISL